MRRFIKIYFIPVLIFTAVFLYGCTASSGNDIMLSDIPVKELKQKLNQNSDIIQTLEASGNISFDSPEQSGSGWLELKIKKPDTVFVKIEGPFGISIANALITRGNFTYYNVQENKAITGPSSDINIGAILKIKVSFDDLISGFTGGFIFDESDEDTSLVQSRNSLYLIQNVQPGGKQLFFIDPELYTITKYKFTDNSNIPQVEVDYSNYGEETASGISVNLPATIKIKNPVKKQSVYVDYVTKEVNKKNITFKMKIPKSAKLIVWE